MSTVPSTNGTVAAPVDLTSLAGRELDPIALGQIFARSRLFPDITRVSQAVVKILAGRELGIGPFASMSDIHLVDGTPVVGARILAALVRQSDVYDYKVVEWTNERCSIDFYRHGEKLEPTVTFTDEDAQRAGLNRPTRSGKRSNHMKFPRNMKFARAMSNGVGLHCPDLTAGTPVYTPDELGGEEPDGDVAPEPEPVGEEPGETLVVLEAAGRSAHERLSDVASECGYSAATVIELCRFFCDRDNVESLSARQATAMAERLRAADHRRVTDARLAALAAKGLGMPDRPRARQAADVWLTRGAQR